MGAATYTDLYGSLQTCYGCSCDWLRDYASESGDNIGEVYLLYSSDGTWSDDLDNYDVLLPSTAFNITEVTTAGSSRSDPAAECACLFYNSDRDSYHLVPVDYKEHLGYESGCKDAPALGDPDDPDAGVGSLWWPPGIMRDGSTAPAGTVEFGDDYAIEDLVVNSLDDWSFMEEWEFSVESVTEDMFDNLYDGAVGIWFEYIAETTDGGAVSAYNKIYHATFEHDPPEFSGGEWTDTTTYEISAELDSDEESLLEIYYGVAGDDLETTFSSVVNTIGEIVALSTADAGHTFKKIRSADIYGNTFDVFEEEEATQTAVVSLTRTETVSY